MGAPADLLFVPVPEVDDRCRQRHGHAEHDRQGQQ
jgi:hypothetical protein